MKSSFLTTRLARCCAVFSLVAVATACAASTPPATTAGTPKDAAAGTDVAASADAGGDAVAKTDTAVPADAAIDGAVAPDAAASPDGAAPKDATPPKDTAPPDDRCALDDPDLSGCLAIACVPQGAPGKCSTEQIACISDMKCVGLIQDIQKCGKDKSYVPELPKDVTPPSDPTQVTCEVMAALKSGDAAVNKIGALNKCIITKCIGCPLSSTEQSKQECIGQCVQVSCTDKMQACANDKACAKVLECVFKCKPGASNPKCQSDCVLGGPPTVLPFFQAIQTCQTSAQANCGK